MNDLTQWTKVYGASDDLIEFEGGFNGEVGGSFDKDDYDDDSKGKGCLVVMSDGTLLAIMFGTPNGGAVWKIEVLRRGPLLDRVDVCDGDGSGAYSDVAHFQAGIAWAYACDTWQVVT